MSFRVELANVPEDIATMLETVSRTQVHANVIPSQAKEVSFKDVNELLRFLSSVAL